MGLARHHKQERCFFSWFLQEGSTLSRKEDDITYTYDDNGNLIEKESAEEQIVYRYDYESHLTRVETSRYNATIVVEYEYDAEGNRIRKTLDGNIVINYLVDTNRDYAQVVEERDRSGNLLVRYVYGHDLISQTRDNVTSYYHYDGLGSTRALSSTAGIVTDEYTYDAFGNLLDKSGVTENTHLYTGEFFDSHLGFYYLRARYMNPQVGGFVTMDSFAGWKRDPYSLHKYLYAHANPVNMIDPSGYSAGFTAKGAMAALSIVGILSNIGQAVYHLHKASEAETTAEFMEHRFAAGMNLLGVLLSSVGGGFIGPGASGAAAGGGKVAILVSQVKWDWVLGGAAIPVLLPIHMSMSSSGGGSSGGQSEEFPYEDGQGFSETWSTSKGPLIVVGRIFRAGKKLIIRDFAAYPELWPDVPSYKLGNEYKLIWEEFAKSFKQYGFVELEVTGFHRATGEKFLWVYNTKTGERIVNEIVGKVPYWTR